ncbi:DUF4132 domain-containing protein [Ruminococcus albus]|uniref:DUF4132 domain-containing protein n=1 Tax=Ruminococcus albus TaxID=1264 RepID=A0A1I1M756_RUMAL|nr:DUF4132 domain-containing protein [Ruminococcus albus]SFC79058.1 protein of unknown function [Ruminococcus albus]
MAIKFPELEQIMLKSGFSKKLTADALEWLDISKERDMELFEKLTMQVNKPEEMIASAYRSAFRNDVIPHNSEELYRRIILMSYKLMDVNACWMLIPLNSQISDMDESAFCKLITDSFMEVYGDEAEARSLALRYAMYTSQFRIGHPDLPTESASYLKAAELTSDNIYTIKLMLCANALEYMSLSDESQNAVSMIKEIMNGDIKENDIYLLTALSSASFFDEELKEHFNKYVAEKANDIYDTISKYMKNRERTLDAFFSAEGTLTRDVLINMLRMRRHSEIPIRSAAKMQTEIFKSYMLDRSDLKDMVLMNNALKAVKPDESLNDDEIKKISREKTAEAVISDYKEKDKIKAYINGDISFDEVWPIVKSTKLGYHSYAECHYIGCLGEDDFITRCIAVLGGSVGRYSDHLKKIAGFDRDHIMGIVEKLLAVGVKIVYVLDIFSNIIEQFILYDGDREDFISSFASHVDDIAAVDITKCNASAKSIALSFFKNDENKYHKQIMSLAGDSSKAISEEVAEIVIKHPEWKNDVVKLLGSKRSSSRDSALTIIERQGTKVYIPELKKALSVEKTDKLKARIGSMLAVVSDEDSTVEKISAEEIVKEMTKGKKASKLDWLFKEPLFPVHKKDGTEADVNYIKALMLCFANSVGLKDPNADIIVAELVKKDVCRLANEVLIRWLNTPPEVKPQLLQDLEGTGYELPDSLFAQAKYKWVLYFASVYGGAEAMSVFDQLMDVWPLWQKGALAKEIPHAITLNGSSEYVMKVEYMSRKHRFNSIRKASADALLCASEKLGISKEEFADLLVPDLGFDENMCRTFDYESRRFKVYISPNLEPEIYCDGKKLKTMPKPAAGDNKQIADAAYKEFTAMKKMMKTVVAAQMVRLEDTMRTARTWTSQNWKKLFVVNPIMHRFAIGLIWGIYKDDKLEKSFRYLDDGSFTTVDDEEFIIPEDVKIGLVHPVELSDDELSAWKQQLKDYEIVQPFIQLRRSVYKPTEEEKNKDCIESFKGRVIKSKELASAMEKIGWRKGTVIDGPTICDFIREDIFARNNGIRATLEHSGIGVDVYRDEDADVTIEDLYFCKLPSCDRIKVNELSDRYFSEIIYQLNRVFP